MKTLFSRIKQVRLRKILTVTLFSLLLMVTTACASAEKQATNPNSQPVQSRSEASLKTDSQRVASRENELLYPGAETPQGRAEKEASMPIITEKDFNQPKPGGLIQREENVGERIKDRIETVKESVEDASAFLKDKGSEAGARPELQPNLGSRS